METGGEVRDRETDGGDEDTKRKRRAAEANEKRRRENPFAAGISRVLCNRRCLRRH